MTGRAPLTTSLGEVIAGMRFFARVPRFLRHPLTVAEAHAILRRRLERRPSDFLTLAREAIYEHPESPYRKLLDLAGCEYGDLARLVKQDGLEGTLRLLFRQGVYLTVEEFKGRRPTVRGTTWIEADPERCGNPRLAAHVSMQSSGSRGARTSASISLDFTRDGAVNKCLSLHARGGPWRVAHWDVPGGAIHAVLGSSVAGAPPEQWFCPVDLADPGLHPRYRWSARAMEWGSRLAGRRLPAPRHVPFDDPLPIARWMSDVLQAGGVPLLVAYCSPVVRLCRVAREAGLKLDGARFALDGEPLTAARLAVIRRAGADAFPIYATTETSRIGEGCLAPSVPDDVHFFNDLHALIQPALDGAQSGLPAQALLVSSLRPAAPLILLNVSMGDQAVISERPCGCALERLGWRTHLHTIRSFEKLTAGGMTFLDTDVIRILEEVLPATFGGAPADYQLVEQEDPDGSPRVLLLVHPRVGPLSSETVARTLLAALGAGSGVERVMGTVWRDADLLRVERRPPLATASGKILHVHLTSRRPSSDQSPTGGPR